jgi:hypothetical protein
MKRSELKQLIKESIKEMNKIEKTKNGYSFPTSLLYDILVENYLNEYFVNKLGYSNKTYKEIYDEIKDIKDKADAIVYISEEFPEYYKWAQDTYISLMPK